jgi:hypothetical protein
MYPFPPADDLKFLVGSRLSRITIAVYSLHFSFENGNWITSVFTVELVNPTGECISHDTQRTLRSDRFYSYRLVGKSVDTINVKSDALELGFDDDSILRVMTEISPYECGQIGTGLPENESRFIVF